MGYSELGIHRRVGHRMRQPLVHSKLLSGLQATNNPPPILHAKIYFVASHWEFNPRKRLNTRNTIKKPAI